MPSPISSPAPISQTVWSGRGAAAGSQGAVAGGAGANGTATNGHAPAVGAARSRRAGRRAPGGRGHARPGRVRDWALPGTELLEPARPETGKGQKLDHERNIRIIEEKLRSFQIPATVTGTNSGPVVTQYEVRPDARIKLSRIEGLADDLAMALAARSIRIEAPIPGKDVVGIEIPNHTSEVVGFRELIDDANMLSRDQQADLRPRPRRVRQGVRRRPGARCPTCSSPAPPARARASASTPSSPAC